MKELVLKVESRAIENTKNKEQCQRVVHKDSNTGVYPSNVFRSSRCRVYTSTQCGNTDPESKSIQDQIQSGRF
jgi:hypothetical protein